MVLDARYPGPHGEERYGMLQGVHEKAFFESTRYEAAIPGGGELQNLL
jgi:hypothetical protein